MAVRTVAREYLRLAFNTAVTTAVLVMAARILAALQHSPDSFAPHLRQKYIAHYAVVITHGVCGCVALVLGLPQFIPWLRQRLIVVHRSIGGIYVGCVLISATFGFRMALIAYGGTPAQLGFALLAMLWLATAIAAIRALLRHDYSAHGTWMIRNYALTFSAVMVRLWLTLFLRYDMPMEISYIAVAWISWIPTLAVAELIIAAGAGSKVSVPRGTISNTFRRVPTIE